MTNVYTHENDDRVGLYVVLDKHDFDNLPLSKVRVLYPNAYFKKNKLQVWDCEDWSDVQAMKISDYVLKLIKENTTP